MESHRNGRGRGRNYLHPLKSSVRPRATSSNSVHEEDNSTDPYGSSSSANTGGEWRQPRDRSRGIGSGRRNRFGGNRGAQSLDSFNAGYVAKRGNDNFENTHNIKERLPSLAAKGRGRSRSQSSHVNLNPKSRSYMTQKENVSGLTVPDKPPFNGHGREKNRAEGKCKYGRGRKVGRQSDGGAYDVNLRLGYYKEYRRVQSLDSLCATSVRSKYVGMDKKTQKVRKTVEELEQLLLIPADVVVLKLLSEKSEYKIFLTQDRIDGDVLACVIKVLAHAVSAQSNMECLYELYSIICHQTFLDKLCMYAMTIKRQKVHQAEEFFSQLKIFLNAYVTAMTVTASEKLPSLIDACLSVLEQSSFENVKELVKEYEALKELLSETICRIELDRNASKPVSKTRLKELNSMEPPENFKELSVVPTVQDLRKFERPFIRQNIVKGKYRDDEQYLDIQFRLLHEDFVRPLRKGINDFQSDTRAKIQDIRIYRDVTICGSVIEKCQIMHKVKLSLPKHMNMQSSKRLMYGNLVCFSCDNFKTVYFGSIADRDEDLQENGMIGVQFDSDFRRINVNMKFIMVESRAFFIAYKFVLQALQYMSGRGVPLAQYVIHVQKNVRPPDYVGQEVQYDLRVVNESRHMKTTGYCRRFYRHQLCSDRLPELCDEFMMEDKLPELCDVFIMEDLLKWPSEAELGLDESQRRALRSALVRELAIIQGPPGTGKTFIGLKIIQVLLHNSKVWKDSSNSKPILVVCYTNHALDQFLEGMTSFTNKIVRVGARSNSEKISRFQINKLARNLRLRSCMPNLVSERHSKVMKELDSLEWELMQLKTTANACRSPKGILSFDVLVSAGVVPIHMLEQLTYSSELLKAWLLDIQQNSIDKQKEEFPSCNIKIQADPNSNPQLQTDTMSSNLTPAAEGNEKTVDNETWEDAQKYLVADNEHDEKEKWEDAQELIKQEEFDRRLTDDRYDEKKFALKCEIDYAVTVDELKDEIRKEKLKTNSNKEVKAAEAYLKMVFCAHQLNSLKIGLALEENHNEMHWLERREQLNIWKISVIQRWQLYKFWLKKLLNKVEAQIPHTEQRYETKARALSQMQDQENLYIMRTADIVGMTTTGAAKQSRVLQDLAPSIVVVEEAAEILESHVITSLTTSCKHLILIGDHQQLRPSPTVYELATKYGLDLSLFERMIKNGLPYETLEYQHRMRPSISRLLVPSIYPELKDHPSVTKYPHVLGIAKDIFFMSHQIHERKESDDNSSHENMFEAEFITALSQHLLRQGYKPEDITILTPYSGQFFLLRKLQRQCKWEAVSKIQICVVDSFQGEENKIILLSLVRSNVEGKVGFLRTDNRVCVALSRAREGLYITGNMDLLSVSSPLWANIKEDLTERRALGKALDLRCQNHPDRLSSVSCGKDILKMSPEGGCLLICGKNLPKCYHTCKRHCHINDPFHKKYFCNVPCPKSLCNLGHPCPKKCGDICDLCLVPVAKVLPCGHEHTILCYIRPETYSCPTKVERTLLPCQHKAVIPCHADVQTYLCPHNCDTRLDCGHECRFKCHARNDPDHLKYNCLKDCTEINALCTQNHQCQKKCYEECGVCVTKVDKTLPCGHEENNVDCYKPPEDIECHKKCKKTLSCGHACKKLCYEICGNCPVKVKKLVPGCNHTIQIECSIPATPDKCDGKCPKKLACGHPCKERCMDVCTTKCPEKVFSEMKCPKDHTLILPCNKNNKISVEESWKYCDHPCDELLSCGHSCIGTCSQCLQGRVHAACHKRCKRRLLCGHMCTHPCNVDCPPCQQKCQRKCKHRQCTNKCGQECSPCKEACQLECPHQKCLRKCGEKCLQKPCEKPCAKMLDCGHPCIGFCGDPCPLICPECSNEEFRRLSQSSMKQECNTRFVWLQDCGHVIQASILDVWIKKDNDAVGVKTCPKCQKPIYGNCRYNDIIIDTYKSIHQVRKNYFARQPKIEQRDIEVFIQDPEIAQYFMVYCQQLGSALGLVQPSRQKGRGKCSEAEKKLFYFQAQVLKKASLVLKSVEEEVDSLHHYQKVFMIMRGMMPPRPVMTVAGMRLQPFVESLVNFVMKISGSIGHQLANEISCEFQRLLILPAFWDFQEEFFNYSHNEDIKMIKFRLDQLLHPASKFNAEVESQAQELLKESEKYINVKVLNSKRIEIVKSVGCNEGSWFRCPNAHIYCNTNPGGNMVKGQCPDCPQSHMTVRQTD